MANITHLYGKNRSGGSVTGNASGPLDVPLIESDENIRFSQDKNQPP